MGKQVGTLRSVSQGIRDSKRAAASALQIHCLTARYGGTIESHHRPLKRRHFALSHDARELEGSVVLHGDSWGASWLLKLRLSHGKSPLVQHSRVHPRALLPHHCWQRPLLHHVYFMRIMVLIGQSRVRQLELPINHLAIGWQII